MRFLDEADGDDPILSVVNLIDVFLVVIAILILILFLNPLNLFSARDVVVIENPGKANMRVLLREGRELVRYEASDAIGEGEGIRVGITYRLPDGRMVYVPENDQ